MGEFASLVAGMKRYAESGTFGTAWGKPLLTPVARPQPKLQTEYRRIPSTRNRRTHKVTEKELCAFDVIVRLWFELGKPPSGGRTNGELGLCCNHKCKPMESLERKGYLIRYTKGGPLTLTLKGCSAFIMRHMPRRP